MRKLTTYGRVDKFLHWVIALNILLTMIFSYGMSSLSNDEKLIEYGDHGMSVTTITILMIVRLVWRVKHGFPLLPGSMPRLHVLAAKAMHIALYIAIFSQIVIGVLLTSTTPVDFVAAGYGINYSSFNLIADRYYDTLLSLHIGIYWLIVVLVVAHVGAALKHHFIDKDDILKRMLPFQKGSNN